MSTTICKSGQQATTPKRLNIGEFDGEGKKRTPHSVLDKPVDRRMPDGNASWHGQFADDLSNTLAHLCFARIKSVFEMNNLLREDVTL